MTASAFCTLSRSPLYALSMACLAVATLPDAIARSMERPTEDEDFCSAFTSAQTAEVDVLWWEWFLAQAVVRGARTSPASTMPWPTSCQIRRCPT